MCSRNLHFPFLGVFFSFSLTEMRNFDGRKLNIDDMCDWGSILLVLNV